MAAGPALEQILAEVAAGTGRYENFALHIDMRDVGLPDVGYVAVPIRLELGEAMQAPAYRVSMTIRSQRDPAAFPVLSGSVGIDARDAGAGVLWLDGSYDVPGKGFGAMVNAVFAGGTADKTLENFLSDLVAAVDARVERREIERVRYTMFVR